MQRVDFIAGEAVEQPVREHGARAAEALFRRLENEHGGAGEIAMLGEIAGGTEQHRGVAVMAAAVEASGDGRAVGQIGHLVHR